MKCIKNLKCKWTASLIIFYVSLVGCQKIVAKPAQFSQCTCYRPINIKPDRGFKLQQGNSPALEKAYLTYLKTARAPNIITQGFIQFAYGMLQPIVCASPFELTVISLEPGESVLSVSCGDPLRWSYSLTHSGNKNAQGHVLVKPSQPNISTDLVITTNKRLYTLKLISKETPDYARQVRFWYPEEIEKKMRDAQEEQAKQIWEGDLSIDSENHFNLERLNFNYRITCPFWGSFPRWAPIRVFDDGLKTYIQFPPTINQQDLPALFIQTTQKMALVNYRIKSPYFIVDHLFERAWLLSGCGHHQQKITLINQHVGK